MGGTLWDFFYSLILDLQFYGFYHPFSIIFLVKTKYKITLLTKKIKKLTFWFIKDYFDGKEIGFLFEISFSIKLDNRIKKISKVFSIIEKDIQIL